MKYTKIEYIKKTSIQLVEGIDFEQFQLEPSFNGIYSLPMALVDSIIKKAIPNGNSTWVGYYDPNKKTVNVTVNEPYYIEF